MKKHSSDTQGETKKHKNYLFKKLRDVSKTSKPGLILFVIIFASIGVYTILGALAAPKDTGPRGKTSPAVTLSVWPSSQRLQQGGTIALAVRLNTNGQSVNAVQADLSYPVDKFEFVNINGAGSAFGVEALSSGINGTISIARGSTTPINSSDALVATINLRAISSGRKVPINFLGSSAVLSSSDSTDILEKTTNGQYTIQ